MDFETEAVLAMQIAGQGLVKYSIMPDRAPSTVNVESPMREHCYMDLICPMTFEECWAE